MSQFANRLEIAKSYRFDKFWFKDVLLACNNGSGNSSVLSIEIIIREFIARQAVRKRSIPFTIEASSRDDIRTQALEAIERIRKSAIESGVAEMSLEYINKEISLARKAR